MTDTDRQVKLAEIPKAYSQPDPSKLSQLSKGGAKLDYEGHADITLDLIEIDPEWSLTFAGDDPSGKPLIVEGLSGKEWALWGTLTVLGVQRHGCGTCLKTKAGDIEKELIGDLLRNCAMRFGVGTKLWSKAERDAPAWPAAPQTIPVETAEMFKGHILKLREDQRAAVREQLIGIAGIPTISQMPLDLLPAVATVVLQAVADANKVA